MRILVLASAIFAISLLGCGRSVSVPNAPPVMILGPHGGIAYRLPSDAGYVEICNEPSLERDASIPTAIVAYFLRPDGLRPIETMPSDLQFEIGTGVRPGKLPLEATEDARFISVAGPYALEAIRGSLIGTLNGERFAIEGIGSNP